MLFYLMRLHKCGANSIFAQYMKSKNPNIKEEDARLVQIGQHVKYLRKKRTKLSAENFAYEKDFDRVQYSRIEKGTNITMKTLLKVIDAHNISLKEFFSSFD